MACLNKFKINWLHLLPPPVLILWILSASLSTPAFACDALDNSFEVDRQKSYITGFPNLVRIVFTDCHVRYGLVHGDLSSPLKFMGMVLKDKEGKVIVNNHPDSRKYGRTENHTNDPAKEYAIYYRPAFETRENPKHSMLMDFSSFFPRYLEGDYTMDLTYPDLVYIFRGLLMKNKLEIRFRRPTGIELDVMGRLDEFSTVIGYKKWAQIKKDPTLLRDFLSIDDKSTRTMLYFEAVQLKCKQLFWYFDKYTDDQFFHPEILLIRAEADRIKGVDITRRLNQIKEKYPWHAWWADMLLKKEPFFGQPPQELMCDGE